MKNDMNMLSRREALGIIGVGTAASVGCVAGYPLRAGGLRESGIKSDNEIPKSVIFMVSDGMSIGVPSLAEPFSRLVRSTGTHFHELLRGDSIVRGLVDTASANSMVTDSAAASSCWSTGERINNGSINVAPDGRLLTPIARIMHKIGKRVGLVTTTRITHATPAAFAAVTPNRGFEFEIAKQYLGEEIEVLLGGGRRQFDPTLNWDKVDLLAAFRQKNYEIHDSRQSLLASRYGERILGLFAVDHLPYTIDRNRNDQLKQSIPTIAEMTKTALESLSKHKDGFLLQIEGGRVDQAAHNNDAGALLWDQLAFDDAIGVVLEFLKDHPDTLLIVTTDHGNANPGLNGVGLRYAESTQAFARLADAKASFPRIREELLKQRAAGSRDEAVRTIFSEWLGIDLEEGEDAIINRAMDDDFSDEPSKQLQNLQGIVGEIAGNYNGIGWTGVAHTSDMVIIMAAGPGRSRFNGLMRNTEIHKHIINLIATPALSQSVTG